MSKWKIVGISGITCGGKTSLAETLTKHFETSAVISQDQFYRSEDDPNHEWVDISPQIRYQNWDCMASIDWSAFLRAIHQLRSEEPSEPTLLIIEGHLIFNFKPISDICDLKYFATLDKDECFSRRSARKHIPDDPIGYFDGWVWPLYLSNVEQMKRIQNDIPIDGNSDQKAISDTVRKSCLSLLKDK